MNTQRIAPASKLRRGSEHYLNGKPIYIERDRGDGTILISDSKQLRPEDNYWNVNKSELKIAYKKGSSISSKEKPLTPNQVKDKSDLNSFFDELKVPFNCQSCRRPLYAFNKKARRGSSAHLLPKSIFKSIATNPDNIVFMGCDVFNASCDCHTIYDRSVEKRVKMPIYELALKRYELLKRHLTVKEIQLADEYLGITAKSQNLTKDIQEGKEGVKA